MKKILLLLAVFALVTTGLIAAELSKATIKVSGLCCAGCGTKVETALSKVDGVESAAFVLESKEAKVEYDAEKTDVSKLEGAIAALGFDAGSTKATDPHECSKEEHKECKAHETSSCPHAKKEKAEEKEE